jgi:hypothetical protein
VTLGFNSTAPSDFDPQYPLSHAHSNIRAEVLLAAGAKRKSPRGPYPVFSIDYQPLFQHHFYFHILTNCGRAMCLTFTSLQKKTGGWGVNVLANSSERQGPPTCRGVMIGHHRYGYGLYLEPT